MRNKIFVVLGNHLFNPDFFSQYKDDHIFYMAEDLGLCTYEKHHKHKILLFLSSMRSFCDELKEKKFEVIYKRIEDNDFELDYLEKLKIIITEKKIETISVFEIEDKPFEQTFLSDLKDIVSVNYLSSPMFLTKRKDFKEYNDSVKKPFMANFYKKQRKENNFLIEEDGSPSGGKWSFDEENRKKIPKEIKLPSQLKFKFTTHTKHLIKIIDDRFKDHIGQLDDFWLCTTRKDAWIIFSHFLDEKINLFGDYEDAVDQRDNVLFHSTLSPLMNLGLITPSEILEKLKKIKDEIKINSIEGYFRQIVGWREFIRGVYQNYDKKFETSNFFNHNRLMKESWYEGSTGLLPLDHSIKNANKYAWTHHIERLMIQANIMNLCEINPKEFTFGLWSIMWILQNGLCILTFMVWDFSVTEVFFLQNLIFADLHISEK
jgi:deoxyribodipyrimidine photolyase-related protein